MSERWFREDGKPWKFWDDVNRQYSEWDIAGALLSGMPRAFNPTENAAADKRIAVDTVTVVLAQLSTDFEAFLVTLDAIIAKTPANITGQDTKDIARVVKKVLRRLTNKLDSAN